MFAGIDPCIVGIHYGNSLGEIATYRNRLFRSVVGKDCVRKGYTAKINGLVIRAIAVTCVRIGIAITFAVTCVRIGIAITFAVVCVRIGIPITFAVVGIVILASVIGICDVIATLVTHY